MPSNQSRIPAGTVGHNSASPGEQFDRPSLLFVDGAPAEVELLYRAIVLDPKYAHFVHIPDRIIRCLDYFGLGFSLTEVKAPLSSYYLFIGVVDDAIDSGQLEIGNEVLQRLRSRISSFDNQTRSSRLHLVTEILKRDINDEVYSIVLAKLHELYQAVVNERKAETVDAYIEERKVVGSLTAELSYILIRPFLNGRDNNFCEFLKRVGSVGCLVDSVLDLAADADRQLLSFTPTRLDFFKLVRCALRDGIAVSLRHPALLRLFLEGIIDNVKDRFRADRSSSVRLVVSERKETAPSVV